MVSQRHVKIPNQCMIRLMSEEAGTEYGTPGTEWIEWDIDIRTKINFSLLNPIQCRLIATASANEENHCGIQIYDVGRAEVLCELYWTGTGVNRTLTSDWKKFPLGNRYGRGESTLTIRVKASSDTENIMLWFVELQIMYYG